MCYCVLVVLLQHYYSPEGMFSYALDALPSSLVARSYVLRILVLYDCTVLYTIRKTDGMLHDMLVVWYDMLYLMLVGKMLVWYYGTV